MKRFALLALLCLFVIPNVTSQENNFEDNLSPQEADEYYSMMFKKKRGTARAFLFSGIGVAGLGYLMADNSTNDNDAIDDSKGLFEFLGGGFAVVLGTLSSVVSIPFYIKAGSYKSKARKAREQMNVTFGTIQSPQRTDFGIGLSYTF